MMTSGAPHSWPRVRTNELFAGRIVSYIKDEMDVAFF